MANENNQDNLALDFWLCRVLHYFHLPCHSDLAGCIRHLAEPLCHTPLVTVLSAYLFFSQ